LIHCCPVNVKNIISRFLIPGIVTLTPALSQREREQKRRDPLSLWGRVRVRVTAVYRLN